jgi:hypothetical protein
MGRFLVIHGAPLEKQSKPENTSSQQQQKASGLVLQFDTVTEVDQGVVMAAATTGQPLTTGELFCHESDPPRFHWQACDRLVSGS